MEKKDRQFVDALARGLAILETFSRANTPLSNKQLTQRTGLAPSTVSRLTHTLTTLGYLRLDESSRRYALTPKTVSLGYSVLEGFTLVDRIHPLLERLAAKTGETAALAVRDGLHVTFLSAVQGNSLVAVRLATGARLPIAVSAAGLALLTQMPERERRMTAARIRADLLRRDGDVQGFSDRLEKALASPVVVVRNVWKKGIGGLAVGLTDGASQFALTLPVSTGAVSCEEMSGELTTALQEVAEEVRAGQH
ncbi:IclR family transcriptional regulator [Ferruginivarius sediminum]|uniref:IclR family transcriptional regulator n=1 Tax=Ferruginivarius sediminum TaxID=2661937 RepID=A0A369T8E3_9PROT|nr:IclR family transcriptional regulator [Ferruginivarius sediminum]